MPDARPRAVIDTLAVYFPYCSFYPEPCIRAGNGISFWRNSAPNKGGKGRYTTLELSRFGTDGIYTPPSKGKQPHEQNNINAPNAKGVNAAIGRLYCGYTSVLAEGDRETFIEMWECYGGDSKELGAYMPRITRLDIALDLPPDVAIAAPDDLLYYVRHGRGSGARYIKVATKQGYIFSIKRPANGAEAAGYGRERDWDDRATTVLYAFCRTDAQSGFSKRNNYLYGH